METNIKNIEENIKLEKTKHNSEIKELKDNISNLKENNLNVKLIRIKTIFKTFNTKSLYYNYNYA